MVHTTYLPAPSTSGYTERREATYNDDGTLSQVVIFVDWADGTTHHQSINLAGPPDHTFSVEGALVYPDDSRTSVSVSADGSLVLAHDWRYASPPDSIVDNRNGTDTWVVRSDGTGTQTSVTEFDNGISYGINKEWHDFDSDGGLSGDLHMVSSELHSETGLRTTIETTITAEGKRTQHTIVEDANGVIADDTLITWTNPPADPTLPERTISVPRGKTQGEGRPPWEGPQAVTARAVTDSGGAGGVCGFGRSVSGGSAGRELCEHYTDYYYVEQVEKVKGEEERGTSSTYLWTRYHGVGPC